MATILIIGQDPAHLAPEDLPPGITAARIRGGLDAARDTLEALGHEARILWTTTVERIADELAEAARGSTYDVVVIGAGLRTLPPMARHFELLMNAIRMHAPGARLAFNSRPDDTAEAARRQLDAR